LQDLDNIRSFLSGMGPSALFDLPWLPLYLAICFVFHPLIGLTALTGAIVLIGITLLTELTTRSPMRKAADLAVRRSAIAETSSRNAEALVALGMMPHLARRWNEVDREYLANHERASDRAGGLGATAKVLRLVLQSAVLAVGAWLVIQQQATAGIIIAGSILSARALAPVDLAIAHWRGLVAARLSWRSLGRLLEVTTPQYALTSLARPYKRLSVETISVAPPGDGRVVVQDVSFEIAAGHGLGIVGPVGSGKSCLVRALVGVWKPARGTIRLDGASLNQWPADVLGRHIGYLPQDVELFAGTVAQNIARFDPDADSESIIAAATEAGVHELIVAMRDGYDTEVGEQGVVLSAGQAQLIAVARAVYGQPFLLVLDEPGSNLDHDGDEALTKAILSVRSRGGIVVIVAHRPVGIAGVDMLLVLREGRIQAFGAKDQVLAQSAKRNAAVPIGSVLESGSARP
jgi:PrtD family type I secretion system ABC transporter